MLKGISPLVPHAIPDLERHVQGLEANEPIHQGPAMLAHTGDEGLDLAIQGLDWHDLDTVSYTHLDVYKRQARDWARANGHEEILGLLAY